MGWATCPAQPVCPGPTVAVIQCLPCKCGDCCCFVFVVYCKFEFLVLLCSVSVIEPKVLEMGNSSSPLPLLNTQLAKNVSGSPSPLLTEPPSNLPGMCVIYQEK